MALELGDVRYWMNSGKHMLALSFSVFDPQETSTGIWLSRDYRRSIISRFPSGTLACSARALRSGTDPDRDVGHGFLIGHCFALGHVVH
jgi:hypothetical protein